MIKAEAMSMMKSASLSEKKEATLIKIYLIHILL